MRRVTWLLLGCSLIAGSWLLASCSEDSVTTSKDHVNPTTSILYPISTADDRKDISDSVDVYVMAKDDRGIAHVEIWTASETEETPEMIASLDSPLSSGEIPDTLRPTNGSSVFRERWRTRFIRNGTIVRLFSRAYDGAGNTSRSDLVVVRILNEGGDLSPPDAQFLIRPANGTVEQVFAFDASMTTDEIDPPELITVRWDFDGDGVWDRDFDEELPATALVEHKYALPRVYTVKMEAKNSYLPNRVSSFQRSLEVANVGGIPRPPQPEEMIRIPAGIYRVGTSDPNLPYADQDEYPLHEANTTSPFVIRRTEEPNWLYLRFLKEELEASEPKVRREGSTEMWFYPDEVEPVEEDSIPRLILNLSQSAIFYDPEGDTMAVEPEERSLPVVGVSWWGAKAYAEHFGLRLPTEHEWEIAAKADSVGFLYPWGTTISPDQANYSNQENPIRQLKPIGAYPNARSPFGLLDMSGNAKEWVKDWYSTYVAGRQTNPEGPVFGSIRVVRGGSYLNTSTGVRVTGREAMDPNATSSQVGFRTAYTP